MKRKTVIQNDGYADMVEMNGEPLKGIGKIIPDFLPSPEELASALKTEKVTLSLSSNSLDFIRNEAKKKHCSYQKMIRELIDSSVKHWRRAYSS